MADLAVAHWPDVSLTIAQNPRGFAEAKEKPPEVQSAEEKKTPKAQRFATSEPSGESSRQLVWM